MDPPGVVAQAQGAIGIDAQRDALQAIVDAQRSGSPANALNASTATAGPRRSNSSYSGSKAFSTAASTRARSTGCPSAARSDVARSASSAGKPVAFVDADADDDVLDPLAGAHHLGQHAGQLAAAVVGVDQLHVVRPLEARRHAQRRQRARDGRAGQQREGGISAAGRAGRSSSDR